MTIDPSVAAAIATAAVAALGRALWVLYRDLRADRDYWRDVALAAIRHTDKALDVAEPLVKTKADGA